MKQLLILSALIMSSICLFAKTTDITEEAITLSTPTGEIKGVLRTPSEGISKTIAIIVSGASRTDRDGNQPQTKNNSLKMLSEGLVNQNITTLNFDKRGVGQSQRAGIPESKVTIDLYAEDVKLWINQLKEKHPTSEVIVIGHGEGSLIGMLASIDNANVSKYISIAGTSKKASDIVRLQFARQNSDIKAMINSNLQKLEKGEKLGHIDEEWRVLFGANLQPFLISLYKYDPKDEIKKLKIPTLIIQGDKDVQSSIEDAELLADASLDAEKVIISNMNYVLKECEKEGRQNQIDSYIKPNFPLNKDLVPTIVEYISNSTIVNDDNTPTEEHIESDALEIVAE